MGGDLDGDYDDAVGTVDEANFKPPTLIVGERCSCRLAEGKANIDEAGGKECLAQVMFIGTLPSPMPAGYWVGVFYDLKVGKNDGMLNGRKYFQCPPGHGGFLRPSRVRDHNEQKRREVEAEQAAEDARQRRAAIRVSKKQKEDGTAGDGGDGGGNGGDGGGEGEGSSSNGNDGQGGAEAGVAAAAKEGGAPSAVPPAPTAEAAGQSAAAEVALATAASAAVAPARVVASARERRSVSPPHHGGAERAPRSKTSRGRGRTSRPDRSSRSLSPEASAARLKASRWRASGTGVSVARVGTLAQFTLSMLDADGRPASERSAAKRASFVISVRGRASLKDSQPTSVRTKLIDRGDGTYQVGREPCAPTGPNADPDPHSPDRTLAPTRWGASHACHC